MNKNNQKQKNSQSKNLVNHENFQDSSINKSTISVDDFFNNLTPQELESYKKDSAATIEQKFQERLKDANARSNKIAELFEDEKARFYIINNIVWAGGEGAPSYRLKHIRGALLRIAFFFVKYAYEIKAKGRLYDPTYNVIISAADVDRASVASALKIFETIGALEITRTTNSKGYTTTSQYEVNLPLMEKFIYDNYAEIEFYDDEDGKRKPRLKRYQKTYNTKKEVIHTKTSESMSKKEEFNYIYKNRNIVNKKEISIKNVDKYRDYKIQLKELRDNLHAKLVTEMLNSDENVLKRHEINNSAYAFYKMCDNEGIFEMKVNEFKRRLKAWILSFNKRVVEYIAKKGKMPIWKSLRQRLSNLWSHSICSLNDDFYREVTEFIKKIPKAKNRVIDREKMWKAKEILINKKNYLTSEEKAIKILANYVLNLK